MRKSVWAIFLAWLMAHSPWAGAQDWVFLDQPLQHAGEWYLWNSRGLGSYLPTVVNNNVGTGRIAVEYRQAAFLNHQVGREDRFSPSRFFGTTTPTAWAELTRARAQAGHSVRFVSRELTPPVRFYLDLLRDPGDEQGVGDIYVSWKTLLILLGDSRTALRLFDRRILVPRQFGPAPERFDPVDYVELREYLRAASLDEAALRESVLREPTPQGIVSLMGGAGLYASASQISSISRVVLAYLGAEILMHWATLFVDPAFMSYFGNPPAIWQLLPDIMDPAPPRQAAYRFGPGRGVAGLPLRLSLPLARSPVFPGSP